MNARERRNLLKTNTPKVRGMAAQLKMIGQPKRAERLLELLNDENEWLTAVQVTTQYEQQMPLYEYETVSSPYKWSDDALDAISYMPIPASARSLPRIKHGQSKADRISNLATAEAARRQAKGAVLGEEVRIDMPKLNLESAQRILGMQIEKIIFDELSTLAVKKP